MRIKILILAIILIIFSFGCNEQTSLGLGMLPQDDLVSANMTDTVSVIMKTEKSAHLLSGFQKYLLVGQYTDPVFGKSEASFMTQVMQTSLPKWDETTVFDSIYLSLPVEKNDIYGETGQALDLSVYKVTDTLLSKNYYSDENPSNYTDYTLLGSGKTSLFIPKDTSLISEVEGVRLKLNYDFGKELFDHKEEYFESPGKFYDIFKGIYVKSNNATGIYKIRTNISSTNKEFGIIIYTHQTTKPDSALSFVLPITSGSVRFNMFSHDYTGTEVETALKSNGINDKYAYLQSMAGLEVKLDMPSLKQFSNLLIIRAKLVLNLASNSINNKLKPNNELWLVKYDSTGAMYYLSEYLSRTYLGQNLNNNQYVFDVTKLVNDIISDDASAKNYNFYITDLLSAYNNNRTILNTNKNSTNPSKLIITYTTK